MGWLKVLCEVLKAHGDSTAAGSSAGAKKESAKPDGSAAYGAYIKSLLDYEQSRRVALEGKASAVITTSGALVTLLFGLVAVISGSKTFVLPSSAHGWLGAAVILFVIAAAFSIGASGVPVGYGDVSFSAKDLDEVFHNPAEVAAVQIAGAQLQQITIAKKKNTMKAYLVIVGASSELVALAMLTVAIFQIVSSTS
jgi:hypothetical protein